MSPVVVYGRMKPCVGHQRRLCPRRKGKGAADVVAAAQADNAAAAVLVVRHAAARSGTGGRGRRGR